MARSTLNEESTEHEVFPEAFALYYALDRY